MQTEISKMSDEELIKNIEDYCSECNGGYKNFDENKEQSKQELLKRLSKNNIEEFKKKLIKEIEKSYFIPSNKEDKNIIKKLNPLFETYKNKIIDLINN